MDGMVYQMQDLPTCLCVWNLCFSPPRSEFCFFSMWLISFMTMPRLQARGNSQHPTSLLAVDYVFFDVCLSGSIYVIYIKYIKNIYMKYTPVTNIAMEYCITFSIANTSSKGPFSIVMLVYQRVSVFEAFLLDTFFCTFLRSRWRWKLFLELVVVYWFLYPPLKFLLPLRILIKLHSWELLVGRYSTFMHQLAFCHQEFQVPKMEVLNLVRLFWGWVFPYISLTYSFYIGEYLHFRYLKCLVILPCFQSPSNPHVFLIGCPLSTIKHQLIPLKWKP